MAKDNLEELEFAWIKINDVPENICLDEDQRQVEFCIKKKERNI